MFGYVVPDKPNMLIKDFAVYRAYYCGMCKAIGRRGGQKLRMTINYDLTLLALFAVNITREEPKFLDLHCGVHPFNKEKYAQADATLLPLVDINTILGYHKAADDAADERKLVKRLAKLFLSNGYRKAKKRMPSFDKVCVDQYARLSAYERDGENSLDKLADPFASIMREVGRTIGGDELYAKLCYNLGRWIYFLDAADDLEDDVKLGRFNPFVSALGVDCDHATIYAKAKELIAFATGEIKELYNKMDITVSEGALSNIIYLGLDTRAAEIFNKRCQNVKKSV